MAGADKYNENDINNFRKQINKIITTYEINIDHTTVRRLLKAVSPEEDYQVEGDFGNKEKIKVPDELCMSMMAYGFIPGDAFPVKRGLDGWHEYYFCTPVYINDTLTVNCKLTDVKEKNSKMYKTILILEFETIIKNQIDATVCIHNGAMILY